MQYGYIRVSTKDQNPDRQIFAMRENGIDQKQIYMDYMSGKLDIQMRIVDGRTFNNELQKTIQGNGTEYIFEAFQNDMDEDGRLIYDSNIHIENSFTLWFLEQIGFKWNETDFKYLSGYVEYFRSLGYLEV